MPHLKHPIKTKWFKPTTTPTTLTALSDAYQWNAHWLKGFHRSFKCLGDHCPLCAKGNIPTERYVILVEDSHGKAWFLELRERHRDTLQQWTKFTHTLAGVTFIITKREPRKTAPVDIDFIEHTTRREIPIGHFVNSLGADPSQLRLEPPPS